MLYIDQNKMLSMLIIIIVMVDSWSHKHVIMSLIIPIDKVPTLRQLQLLKTKKGIGV